MRDRATDIFCLVLVLGLSLSSSVSAALFAEFEGPADGQPVAGIGTIQGWAFSDTAGVSITAVSLVVDGTVVGSIPCCSERGDVAAAYPELPPENTLNSGFGITQNFNLISPGEHTLTLTITDSSGAQATRRHTVTVVQPGGFEFLDRVDLSEASAERQGQDIVLSNVRIRDAITQQAAVINARLRWFRNRQGLGLVEATTVGPASTMKTARSWLTELRQAKTSAASLAPIAAVDNPGNGDTVAGAALIQGFAFARTGRSITRVQLFIDGEPSFTIPCCSDRADVAAAFPDEPNALTSGFGLTFNYGLLSSGVHQLMVEVEDSEGDIKKVFKGILVKRPGEFEFLADLDLSTSTVRIANGCLVVEGAIAREASTSQTVTRILRYRFLPSLQGFQLFEEYIDEVIVTNVGTDINGDTSSVTALKTDDGGDGISFPEATAALNNTAEGERILITFAASGTIVFPFFDPSFPVQTIQRAQVTIDGDVDGDGAPDVTLESVSGAAAESKLVQPQGEDLSGLRVEASAVIIRGLTVHSALGNAVEVAALPGRTLSDITLVGLEAKAENGAGIVVEAQAEAGQEAHVNEVLISQNWITAGGLVGIALAATGTSSTAGSLTLMNVTLAENTAMNSQIGMSIVSTAQGAMLTQIAVSNNQITNMESRGIQLLGGSHSASGNLVMAEIQDNIVAGAAGISVEGGSINSPGNMVEVAVVGNEVNASSDEGVRLTGGFDEALDNIVFGEIRGNEVEGSPTSSGVLLGGGRVASRNMVEAVVADNAVADAMIGIRVNGGIALGTGEAGVARNNIVTGEIARNEVLGSLEVGIAAFGGVADPGAEVVENLVRQDIISNTADGFLCQDGLASNTAECTFSGNTDTSGVASALQSLSKQTPLPIALAHRLNAHKERVARKEQQIRERAEIITDERLRKRLFRLCNKLKALQGKLTARIAGQSPYRLDW